MKRIDNCKLQNISGGCQRWARRYSREANKFSPNEEVLDQLLDAYDACVEKKFSRN